VILKSILDPGDEVLLLAPFFAEYPFYIGNHGGRAVTVETTDDFLPDIERIANSITPRTRAILLNTPNNPTGRIYPERILVDLQALLARLPNPPLVISDEPYKRLTYDGKKPRPVAAVLSHTAICYSWSKAQALAGERIGYLALSPRIPDGAALMNACAFANRTLGFVNAPALWQRVMALAADACVDISAYELKRDRFCHALASMGYTVQKPEGGYYIFLKTPIADDVKFVGRLVQEGILAVPGTGFGRGGYLRLTLTVPMDVIERSLPGFERVLQAYL
jgi:aspartate aminotransferase